jgi:short-subunit dehydrogenase
LSTLPVRASALALRNEPKDTGITITTLMSDPTGTEF